MAAQEDLSGGGGIRSHGRLLGLYSPIMSMVCLCALKGPLQHDSGPDARDIMVLPGVLQGGFLEWDLRDSELLFAQTRKVQVPENTLKRTQTATRSRAYTYIKIHVCVYVYTYIYIYVYIYCVHISRL